MENCVAVRRLEIEDLRVAYQRGKKRVPALRGVSLTLSGGKIVGLMGQSGCGKSTLAWSILRLLPKSAEMSARALRLCGLDLLAVSESSLESLRGKTIALIPQDALSGLCPYLSVERQVARVLGDPSEWRATMVDTLSKLGLHSPTDLLAARPLELSGGMRQRALLAWALQMEPAVLFADEPSTALDRANERRALDLIGQSARERIATLIISHSFRMLASVADRICVMYAGRIVETGTPREFRQDPLHPYTAALLEAELSLRTGPDAGGGPNIATIIASKEGGCSFARSCPHVHTRCLKSDPALSPVDNGREVACFLHHDDKVS